MIYNNLIFRESKKVKQYINKREKVMVGACLLNQVILFKLFFFQESYVWKMYQERCWEFFPAGDCFRKQYEDQLN